MPQINIENSLINECKLIKFKNKIEITVIIKKNKKTINLNFFNLFSIKTPL